MKVKASSFADPADVAAYQRCIARGYSQQFCFTQGDNGIGFTGINCATDKVAIVALPREEWIKKWGTKRNASRRLVTVKYRGKTIQAILGDTMPSYRNIKNGAGIDLNPGAAKLFGLTPPFLVNGVEWEWYEPS